MSPPSRVKTNASDDDVMAGDDVPSLSLQTPAEDAAVYQDNEDEENGGRANSVKGGPDTSLIWKSGKISYQFHENPMVRCVWILLILRAIERSIFFGLLFINPGFLTGYYNPNWNPGFTSSKANTFISSTQALQSSLPFIIAAFADICAGDFWTLAILLCVFFVPGVLLVFLSAVPFLLGETFPIKILRIGMQILYTVGSGGVDAICDIFGAKQFHPVRHAHQFEPYFVWTIVVAGVGGVMAEIGYSMLANVKVAISFGIMFVSIAIGTLLFFFGTKRYIVRKINREDLLLSGLATVKASFFWKKADNGRIVACRPGFNKVKESNGGSIRDDLVSAARRLFLIIPVQALFIPGHVAYQQRTSLMIPMSYSMEHPRLWIGSNMIFVDSASVALFGILCNKFLYPYLEERRIRLSTIRKVIIGQSFFVLVYLSMIGIDHRIRRVYEETGEEINIGWQFFPYFISAPAIIFSFPSLNALAYMIAPNEWKILGNAINTFMQAGASNLIARALYKRCGEWFAPTNGSTTINGIENYTNASSNKFMWLMCGFAALQVLLCMLPGVDRLYQKIENDIEAENKEGLITKEIDKTENNTTVLPGPEIDVDN
ncbi:hypothetical protein ACHAW5_003464 [Stephanodiscus triporus]|uniref:Uncharacterized protein n=1 Tax=Stephanodiscus triporus TaxID=2934178 RepID=A0ABD3N1W3_9STRA